MVRAINGTTNRLYYSDWNLIDERNVSDTQLAKYVHGAVIDEILAMTTTNSAHYYHHDAINSATHVTDSVGNVAESYSYDVFGSATIFDGGGTNLTSTSVGNRFLFTGREFLTELGLHDYRNRLYSQALGRFLQTDPIRFSARDVNLYRYVDNNPINRTDPLGLASDCQKQAQKDYYKCLAKCALISKWNCVAKIKCLHQCYVDLLKDETNCIGED